MDTKFEKHQFFNTVTGIVGGLENEYTIVDLRNESSVSGKIKKVDGYMNIDMEDVIFHDSRGNKHTFESFFISARNVRYVHIPKKFTAKELFDKQCQKITRGKPAERKERTFKKSRAQKYQQETLRTAYAPQDS